MSDSIPHILGSTSILPMVVVESSDQAVRLTEVLLRAGLPIVEITLRHHAALDAIESVAKAFPDAIVGAGTIRRKQDALDAKSAGAQFAVSPGTTMDVLEGCRAADLPLLPGMTTPSEAMCLAAEGFRCLKFFPAMQAGGPNYVKALYGPFPDLRFCPSGGVGPENAQAWLRLPNVTCVSGSWIAPVSDLRDGNWNAVRERAVMAVQCTGTEAGM